MQPKSIDPSLSVSSQPAFAEIDVSARQEGLPTPVPVAAKTEGRVDVDRATFRHETLAGVYDLGDIGNDPDAICDGYGSSLLEERMLLPNFWLAILEGKEWMAKPSMAA